MKYIPLIVYSSARDEWYVVAADEVVRLVSRKARGQHTENPFESATLSVKSLASFRVDGLDALRAETLRAIVKADKRPDVRAAMVDVLGESKALAKDSLEKVRALFE